MKILSSKAHGILDYLLSAFLLLTPTLFQTEGMFCKITYVIGGIHLLLTILTRFELGLIKVIPFRIHGLIELVVSIALAGLAFWFHNEGNSFAYWYYLVLAITVLIVFIITDFTAAD